MFRRRQAFFMSLLCKALDDAVLTSRNADVLIKQGETTSPKNCSSKKITKEPTNTAKSTSSVLRYPNASNAAAAGLLISWNKSFLAAAKSAQNVTKRPSKPAKPPTRTYCLMSTNLPAKQEMSSSKHASELSYNAGSKTAAADAAAACLLKSHSIRCDQQGVTKTLKVLQTPYAREPITNTWLKTIREISRVTPRLGREGRPASSQHEETQINHETTFSGRVNRYLNIGSRGLDQPPNHLPSKVPATQLAKTAWTKRHNREPSTGSNWERQPSFRDAKLL